MHPKHVPLFRLALVTSLAGWWLAVLSLYWIMMVEVTTGARLVGYFGWGLGLVSVGMLTLSMLIKPRPRQLRSSRGRRPLPPPHVITLASWICLPLSAAFSLASVAAALQNYLELAGLLGSVAGLFGGYEKYQRDKRQRYYDQKQQKRSSEKSKKAAS